MSTIWNVCHAYLHFLKMCVMHSPIDGICSHNRVMSQLAKKNKKKENDFWFLTRAELKVSSELRRLRGRL